MQLSSLGITPQKEKQFAKKEILSAEDLVAYLPRSYKDFTRETGILPDTELTVSDHPWPNQDIKSLLHRSQRR